MKYQLLLLLCLSLASSPISAQTTVELTSSKDITLYESNTGAISNALGTNMVVGRTNNGFLRRALVHFDISGLPSNAQITDAVLTLNMNRTQAGDQNINLHKVTKEWSEGTSMDTGGQGGGVSSTTNDATWIHTSFSLDTWINPGGDFVSGISATTAVGGNGTYDFSGSQTVSDVQDWLDNGSNFGWILIGNEGENRTTKHFSTKDDLVAAVRPKLSVTYTTPTCTNPFTANITVAEDTLIADQSGGSYQWLDCSNADSPVSGATSQKFEPGSSGSFRVVITIDACIDTSDCSQITLSAINSIDLSSDIAIYPNPVTQQLNIDLRDFENTELLEIFNSSGKLVHRISEPASDIISLQTENWAQGIYYIQLQNRETLGYLKFIKIE